LAQTDFTSEEVSTLSEILTSYLSDLRMEIASTDNREWRGAMKEKEVLIKGLLELLATTGKGT
jgi:hypothetical protein